MCCKLPGVESMSKPMHQWCDQCAIGKGCRIYETRPQDCRNFVCLWLSNESMPEELRPDRSRVIFYEPPVQPLPDTTIDLMVLEDPQEPGRWKRGAIAKAIDYLLSQKLRLCVSDGTRHFLVTAKG